MSKKEMLWAIFAEAKNAAILQNKYFDEGKTFLDLAFMSEEDLKSICIKLKIIKPCSN